VRTGSTLLLAGQLLGPQQHHALGLEQRLDLLQEAPVLLVDQLVHAPRHRRQRLARREPVGAGGRLPGVQAALEGGHPHHEELVQVRAEDGQELHALQQGHRGILRLFQHAAIELQPRQLAIHEGIGIHVIPAR